MPRDARKRPRVGLALGGGGALGIAHVGVLRVLDELGVKADLVAGTSAGAMVGGAYCAGLSIEEMTDLCLSLTWAKLRRRVFPRFALFSNEPMGAYLRGVLPVHTFEQLNTPLRVVATDLDTAQLVVIGAEAGERVGGPFTGDEAVSIRGDLIDAIRASCAIPVIFEPVQLAGRRLVDGGLICDVPAAILRQIGADVVIAVDLLAQGALNRRPSNIVQYCAQTYAIQRTWAIRRRRIYADVIVRPDLCDFKWGHFDRAGVALERGARAARRKADDILRAVDRPGARLHATSASSGQARR